LSPGRRRRVYALAVARPFPRVKADDVVLAFHISPPLVFLVAEIGPHTRNGKILPAAVQRRQPVVLAGDKPAGFIKDGLHGKFVMLKEQVLLDRKSTRLNSSHVSISYAVFCLKKKNKTDAIGPTTD